MSGTKLVFSTDWGKLGGGKIFYPEREVSEVYAPHPHGNQRGSKKRETLPSFKRHFRKIDLKHGKVSP